ncbi:MAG: SMC family ATPase [Nocardioidaceae bacterium]|nr:SMC family ATPase [Nocardioidaceae bacterium]
MRLHTLTATAFGPFSGTVSVDFDALAAGGLFLLTGATGAGKTSVLDAVCFALYGQVPGDRSGAKHLHSDHAPADREPRVVLDLSIGERRFRFSRSPSWTRPKRRGDGVTTVQAHVVVEEQRDGSWTALTNRLDDAGLLVSDLLGMSCAQFTQVAMLPQGRFQAFLRASSAERHAVLQQLFRTDRFERVERWLVERRTADRRASEAAGARVRGALHRIEEAGGTPLPEEWAEALELAAEDERLRAWSSTLTEQASADAADAHAETQRAILAEETARDALASARALVSLVERATRARSDLDALDAEAAALAAARDQVDRHRRAAALTPLAARLRSAEHDRRQAASAWAEQLARHGHEDRPALAAARRTAATELATAEAFLPRARALAEGEQEVATARTSLAETEAVLREAEAGLSALPERLAAAEARHAQAVTAQARLGGLRARSARLTELVAAAKRLAEVDRELDAARAGLQAAIAVTLDAREQYLDVREARISGMAAELAGDLVAGCGCPVCGSAEHPAPAHVAGQVAGRTVGRDEETAARRRVEDAAFAEQNHQVKVAGLESEQAGLAGRLAAEEVGSLPGALAEARTEEQAAADLAAGEPEAAAALAAARTELTETRERADGLRLRAAMLRTEIEDRTATLDALRAERAALLGDAPDLDDLVAQRTETLAALDRALVAWDALDLANRTVESARGSLDEAARAAGFAGTEAALDALLDPPVAERLAETVAAAQRRRIAAEATLADPAVAAALEADAPDLPAATAAHAEAATRVRGTAARAEAARTRSSRLRELDAHLDEALAAWSPLRARHRLSAELASLAEGRSVDNPLKMRLAAYVLAERLRQVVAAANERLARMTGERYALEHAADRGVGEQRGGLSLRVRDDWSGVRRDPATLSGGETFVVSLALALGLADTVAHEAGGTVLDTLFIDEGFGSLDADTLEDVMDTLDGLRDGGRVVGLVSHVPELRSRITTQLEVVKGRDGSTLRAVLAGN